ncbi:MAG: hypothetical protein GC161_17500 [Planctomycetaceae bacterium]|nr:hypothetical protein [Planctomycetaceae bacterium]
MRLPHRPRSTPTALLGLGMCIPLLFAASKHSGPPTHDAQTLAQWRAHYAAVEAELEAGDAATCDPDVLARRAAVRAALAEYRERGEFGIDTSDDGERRFLFIDEFGRRCAVAMLFDRFGAGELTLEVARDQNRAMVIDLVDDPRVASWIQTLGLSEAEAARIQFPGGAPIPPGAGAPSSPPPDYEGPGDGPGGRGSAPTTGPVSGGQGGPATGGGPTAGPAARGGTPARSGTRDSGSDYLPEWWSWWEYNKLDFLAPVRSAAADGGGTSAESSLVFGSDDRAALIELLSAQLKSPDADLRAAGAMALARVAGARAHAELLPLLGDAHNRVRHGALLAFGLIGDGPSCQVLLGVARSGRFGSSHISDEARDVAIVALGLARRRGQLPELDMAVAGLVGSADDRAGAYGLMLYPALVKDAKHPLGNGMAGAVRARLEDDGAGMEGRARAAESLLLAGDPAAVKVLSHLLGSARGELRRSAALALSESDNPLALPALQTAYELEANASHRSAMLLTMGRFGAPARSFLSQELRRGRAGAKPFAALGLGLALRAEDDSKARQVLRDAARGVKSDDARGAYALALGLARDGDAVPWLAEVLTSSGNAQQRSYAAQALGLVGTDAARDALLAASERETSPAAIVGIAHGLAQFGREEDSARLADDLERVRDPALGNQLAAALVFHDTEGAYRTALRWAGDEAAPGTLRAAATEALGLLVDNRPRLAVGAIARQSNHELFPAWLHELWNFGL